MSVSSIVELSAQEKIIILQWRVSGLEERLALLRHEQATTVVDENLRESYRLYYEKELRNNTARRDALIDLMDLLASEMNNSQ